MELRKCFVLRETEIEMEDLKKGDVFRLEKANPKDCINDKAWSLAKDNAKPCEPEGNYTVTAFPMAFVKQPSLDEISFKS